jgi:hypothetical protein
MCDKASIKKTKARSMRRVSRSHPVVSVPSLKMRYKFLILLGVLALAETAIVMRIETPVVWTFLYGIGGWAALTNNLGKNLR